MAGEGRGTTRAVEGKEMSSTVHVISADMISWGGPTCVWIVAVYEHKDQAKLHLKNLRKEELKRRRREKRNCHVGNKYDLSRGFNEAELVISREAQEAWNFQQEFDLDEMLETHKIHYVLLESKCYCHFDEWQEEENLV